MSISSPSDCNARGATFLIRRGAAVAFLILLQTLTTAAIPAQAQAPGAQRAIERLEGCTPQERQSRCVAILKVEPRGDDKQAIKAQVRGRRIIWYEYDRRSGKVRRTN
jgi:hypothetical protein